MNFKKVKKKFTSDNGHYVNFEIAGMMYAGMRRT